MSVCDKDLMTHYFEHSGKKEKKKKAGLFRLNIERASLTVTRFNLRERRAFRRVALDNVERQVLSTAYMLIIIISVIFDAGKGKGQPQGCQSNHPH